MSPQKSLSRWLQHLIDEGVLTPEDFPPEAFHSHEINWTSLLERVLTERPAKQMEVRDAFATQLGWTVWDPDRQSPDPAAAQRIPVRFAWFYRFVPLSIEGKTLHLACAWPLDLKTLDEIRVHFGLQPQPRLATLTQVNAALKQLYGLGAETLIQLDRQSPPSSTVGMEQTELERIDEDYDEASITRLVQQILLEAWRKRATDVHLEPYREKVRVRYRVDGCLIPAPVPAALKRWFPAVVSRIKVMTNLSIIEHRLPQDGSAVVRVGDQTLDLRVSIIPTTHGESVVIRLLPTKMRFKNLSELGFTPSHVTIIRSLIEKPHGILLVTGPTGSGKTTTLYACLNEIDKDRRKIITLEDPVEYELEGITQIQIQPQVGMTFARGLRSVLRHDPDVIMVGEIRDLETAQTAIRTALTGHLVFSTLHTNDAASAVTRLLEMGVEPYMVASSVEAFVAQRLVRLLCPHCRYPTKHPMLRDKQEMARALGLTGIDDLVIHQAKGCESCSHTGYYGRTAIYEILIVDDEIRTMIHQRAGRDRIKAYAVRHGMRTLRQAGWALVHNGLTTPAEIYACTESDEPFVESSSGRSEQAVNKTVSANRQGSSTRQQSDARVYPRTRLAVPIRFFCVAAPEGTKEATPVEHKPVIHKTHSHNISAGGLVFFWPEALPVGSVLDLGIQIQPDAPSLDVLAQVVRVEEDEDNAVFVVAVRFLNLSSAQRQRLEEFIGRHRS